jgi:hypothetical protein
MQDEPRMLLARARQVVETGQLAALEVLWGAERGGLYLVVVAIVERPSWKHPRYSEVELVRVPAGRNHTGPVWPEAAHVTELGESAARTLGVPFHFASRLRPSDEGVRWWNRGSGLPCDDCGAELDQNPAVHWFGMCYGCHVVREDKLCRLHVVFPHDVDAATYERIWRLIDRALYDAGAGRFYAGSRVAGAQAMWFLSLDPSRAGELALGALRKDALQDRVELRAARCVFDSGDVIWAARAEI